MAGNLRASISMHVASLGRTPLIMSRTSSNLDRADLARMIAIVGER